jgi:dihydroxy-acid dehydratase
MSLPGCAAIPAPHRDRYEMAYWTGRRIVEMIHADLRPSKVMTRKAFENAIVAASALGASTNCPPHVTAIARHMGVELDIRDWDRIGYAIPLLVNLMPAGEYLGEEFYRAGGVPAVMHELLQAGKLHADALTVSGKTVGEVYGNTPATDRRVIREYAKPLQPESGFAVLSGNLFDAAVMKTSVISPEFRKRYLENPQDPGAFEGRAIVFEGPEDYHERINDPSLAIDADCMLFIRGTGPIGYPGAAEVVNMLPPDALVKQGITMLPCIGDGRQSGTSASPSILNASPESAVGGGLALLKTGDRVRIDLGRRTADILISADEYAARKAAWKAPDLESQTPWQELQRRHVGQLSSGACLDFAVKYQRISSSKGLPRDNH